MTEEIKPQETAQEAAPAKAKKPAKVQKRKPIKGSRVSYKDRHKLNVEGRDPNFRYRWVNTDDRKYAGRVEKMMARGYTLANDDESLVDSNGIQAGQIGSQIGTPVGNGTRAVLMKIPIEHYEEDLAAKQAEVDRTEEGMVSEELRSGASDIVGDGLKVSRPSFKVQQN